MTIPTQPLEKVGRSRRSRALAGSDRGARLAERPSGGGPLRIAFLIPEFPGQTHVLFWREMRELSRLGVTVDLVSTRQPDPSVVCHDWSREAMQRTVYLFPPGPRALARGLWMIVKSGPRAWARIAAIAAGPGVGGPWQRARLVGLAVTGGMLLELARRRGWNHIHVHTCGDSAYVAAMANVLGGLRYSLTLHGRLAWFGRGQKLKWEHAEFAIAVTEKLRREALEVVGPGVAGKIDVAPMGVDTERFVRTRERAVREPGGPWRIVSCGRLHSGKGHQELLRAVALLRSRGTPAELTIIGEGPARPMLEALVRELGLTESVRLLGALDEDRVRAELESADAFALASHEEAIGVATMEAMALSLPVVVTRVGGVPELVRDGVDGLLVPAKDPGAMAAALQSLHDQPELAARLAASAAARVKASFSSRVSAERIARRLGVLV